MSSSAIHPLFRDLNIERPEVERKLRARYEYLLPEGQIEAKTFDLFATGHTGNKRAVVAEEARVAGKKENLGQTKYVNKQGGQLTMDVGKIAGRVEVVAKATAGVVARVWGFKTPVAHGGEIVPPGHASHKVICLRAARRGRYATNATK